MSLTPKQLERYQRHILMPEIGGQGQQKLMRASVLVVGAGGLGCPILSYLTAAGVGTIGICDDDMVSLSNLQRQTLYTEDDIGKSKVDCAIDILSRQNPEVIFIAHETKITPENVDEILSAYDLIIEGVDNFKTRFILNNATIKQKKTFISAAIGKLDGQIAVFKNGEEGQPCYQCLVPEEPDEFQDCEAYGVLGAVPGVVGSLAATEVIRELTGFSGSNAGNLLIYSGATEETRRVSLMRDPACPAHNGG